jgi:hypothetical protein
LLFSWILVSPFDQLAPLIVVGMDGIRFASAVQDRLVFVVPPENAASKIRKRNGPPLKCLGLHPLDKPRAAISYGAVQNEMLPFNALAMVGYECFWSEFCSHFGTFLILFSRTFLVK